MGLVERKPVGALQACGNEGRLISGGWDQTETSVWSLFPSCSRAYLYVGQHG